MNSLHIFISPYYVSWFLYWESSWHLKKLKNSLEIQTSNLFLSTCVIKDKRFQSSQIYGYLSYFDLQMLKETTLLSEVDVPDLY